MTDTTTIRAIDELPYADSDAARMLARALRERSLEGTSARQLAKDLGYKQPIALSHMATGRVPIPIDRAEAIARSVGLDPAAFLRVTLRQRYPAVEWGSVLTSPLTERAVVEVGLVSDLEQIAGVPIAALSAEQMGVLREVVADRSPRRRWLSVHELPTMEAIRAARPSVATDGLSRVDRSAVAAALDHTE